MVTLVKHDLDFILKQIKIAEAHAAGTDLTDLVASPLLPYGLRTVDGSYNNLVPGREQWGASGEAFPRLTAPSWRNENDDGITFGIGTPGQFTYSNNDYGSSGQPGPNGLGGGTVVDADPRIISNLIVDQTLDNPAAIAAALHQAGTGAGQILGIVQQIHNQHTIVKALQEGTGAHTFAKAQLDALLVQHGIEMDGPSIFMPNAAPDEGLSASYNSWFTLFGQFFDHGLDLVKKGGNGTVYIPLQPDDPLYNPASPHTNFMAVTRATIGSDAANVTTPWVDQNQTYTSHPSHQVFLREYHMVGGHPEASGLLLESGSGGLATWGDVKAQARTMLGIELTDADVFAVPLIRTDPYGRFIPDPDTGFAQVIVGLGADGIPNTEDDEVVSGTSDAPVSLVNALRTSHAFLDDVAHNAAPGMYDSNGDRIPDAWKVADADTTVGGIASPQPFGTYDNELLDAHYVTGDGRGNENMGLSTVHFIFHAEHNRLVEHIKNVVLNSGDATFIAEWMDEFGNWDGERLFQAARFTTEMQYQHLVFEEFARKVQPDIDVFMVQPDVDINPAIFAEFAHVVYRFGHSMLNETVDLINADGTRSDLALFDAFLNPLAFGTLNESGLGTVDQQLTAGAIIRGMTAQVGNEIDEFVTNVLRNQLVGIPLDLAAINIARGRDTGMPTLNEARAQFRDMAGGDSQLNPYTSWVDFALNMKNPESVVNFIAAYGAHDSVANATTIAGKRDAAMQLVFGGTGAPVDRLDFLNGRGTWANRETGLNTIDLWIGGLAEKKMPFGGMLGSTFAFIFELQMENLQHADRFYYLSRVQGLNLLTELENNSLAKIVMRNTDLGETGFALPGDIFSVPDHVLYVDKAKQDSFGYEDPQHDNPVLEAISSLVERREGENYIRYNGADHLVIAGTEGADIIIAGGGDDTVWGFGGDDYIEAGYGVDKIMGGDGDDIIVNAGTDIGETDMLHGDAGNDVIHGGSGLALIFGGSGQDFLMTGPDGSEIRGGTGNDFILGGNGPDMLFGNEGNDWIEGAGLFDYIAGDNGELFFNSTIIGHDVLNGGSGDTDYDADSGDDIMVGGDGIQKFIGMWGHDWVSFKGQATAADADMNFPVFPTLPLEVLRDRFSQVEALSGWKNNDTLRGDDRTDELAENAIADATPEGNFLHNELDEAGIARIRGLDQIIQSHMLTQGAYWADGSGDIKPIFSGGNILLGGGGSDVIEGRGGNDVIDGDAWLNVRIRFESAGTAYTADSMGGRVYLESEYVAARGDTSGLAAQFAGRTLDALMLSRTVNPGQLEIQREIFWDESGVDTAFYWDVRANYEITHNADGSVTVAHVNQTVGAIDPITGKNRTSDGIDTLYNIELLRFADGTVSLNLPAEGTPVISGRVTAGQTLVTDLSGISDANGFDPADANVRWQRQTSNGWVDIVGATSLSLILTPAFANQQVRVVVSFTDGAGNPEEVVSAATAPVGLFINGGGGADTLVGTLGADEINGLGGADTIYGLAGDDIISGGGGADIIDGGEGNDVIDGGAGNDVIHGGAGNDTILGGAGADEIHGDDGDDIIQGGAGADTINGGAGDDTIIWNAGDGRDSVDGGNGGETVGDTFVVNGDASAETYRIYTREAWVALGGNRGSTTALDTEIVITRNGTANGQVLAELKNVEEIVINGNGGGDSFLTFGDFGSTSLSYNTIRFEGSGDDDTFDISGLLSGHRVVVRSNGGNDLIIGSLRERDVVELPADSVLADYDLTDNENGTWTMTNGTHSVTYSGNVEPKWKIAGAADQGNDDHHDDDDDDHDDDYDDDDRDADDDDNDDCGSSDDDDVAPPPSPSNGNHQIGTPRADNLVGTAGDDTLIGGAGHDNILGGAGDDIIRGDDGNDFLSGGTGNDIIFGGNGRDDIFGGAGDDLLFGDAGNDRIFGDEGNDTINGGRGDDVAYGGAGDDWFIASKDDGDDVYYGGAGNDTLDMSTITANITADLGSGYQGRGSVSSAQTGNDIIWDIENIVTGSGNDVITASRAVNVMDGGEGNDTFRFLSAADANGDTILGFQPGDRLDFSSMDADACASGKQSFSLVTGDAFTGRAQMMVTHEAREDGDYTVVQGNTYGGNDAEFKISIKGTHVLTADDFNF